MAGLSAAAAVQKVGRNAVVIDKGRGVGGRMATRRFGAGKRETGSRDMKHGKSRDPASFHGGK